MDNTKIIEVLRHGFDPIPETSKKFNRKYPFTNCALVFAYNGTGKTRLSYDFAHAGREDGSPQHTLYYNAYTEDLFTWDNDLEFNTEHRLKINQDSQLIRGLAGYNFSEPLRKYLGVFTDIDFEFQYSKDNPDLPDYVVFNKSIKKRERVNGVWMDYDEPVEYIKISRGEERLFVWCFFRCIIDQVLGGNDAYKSIEYIYIDDPMSSLDDNNVIAFAEQLYSVIRKGRDEEVKAYNEEKENQRRIKFIVSTHHALFYHTMYHGLCGDKVLKTYYLSRDKQTDRPVLKDMDDDTPFYYNVAMMSEIQKAIKRDKLYTYHFTILRSVIEKIQEFFGHPNYNYILEGIKYKGKTYDLTNFTQDELTDFYSRVVNVLTHQGSMFTPVLMNPDNKVLATSIFDHLVEKYHFVLPDLGDHRKESVIHDPNIK